MIISSKRNDLGVVIYTVTIQFQGCSFTGSGLSLRAAHHQAVLATAEGIL
jgi:hypothetical protein